MVEYLKKRGVEIEENVIVTKLLRLKGSVSGAVGYDAKNEEPVLFSFKAMVLATGGAGAIYERTDCPLRVTGDGYGLAYHAGAELRDMEFVQFFPVALAEPGHPPFLLGGQLTEEGRIVNRFGEDIPEKHGVKERPLVLKSRGPLSVAIMKEVLAGNGVEGAVLLDAKEVFRTWGKEGLESNRRVTYLTERLDADEKPLRVAPIAHFNMGGIVSDENGRTDVPGLFAAGEVVGGVHGANRHGGNALTDITVFGARAGRAAAEYASRQETKSTLGLGKTEFERYETLWREGGVSPADVMSVLRRLMWRKVGPIRTKQGLEEVYNRVKSLKEKTSKITAVNGREMLVALEVTMALDAAEFIVKAALERKESRGAHYREDHPEEKEGWLKTVIISKGHSGEPVTYTRPL
jgi:fumarate reductase (CoM/CoB) subunit A